VSLGHLGADLLTVDSGGEGEKDKSGLVEHGS
jgi:hypothetical protein